MLDISYQVDVTHDQNLENFLTMICDNGEYETIIRVEKLLIEESGRIEDSQIDVSLDVGDYF